MCDLCDQDIAVRESARKALLTQGEKLREFAGLLDLVAHGVIEPHSERAKSISIYARAVIKDSVEWI